MSLFSTLGTGASGLGVCSTNLSVIGDNIANINTVGFKSNRATFADMLPDQIGGLGGTDNLGRGARLSQVNTMFGQGSLQSSGSAVHMAITGKGFFQVSDGEANYYTRDGSFYVDEQDYLVTSSGMRVQGFQVMDGSLTSLVDDVQLDSGPLDPEATTEIELNANLSSDADFSTVNLGGGAVFGSGSLDGSGTGLSIAELSEQSDYSTSVTVYDSLGVPHDVTVFFERTSDLTWEYSAVIDGETADLGGGTFGASGSALEIDSGTLTFDTDGELNAFTQTGTPATAWTWPGASAFSFDLLTGLDNAGNPVDGRITAYGGESVVTAIAQDGFSSGNLTSLQVTADGEIQAFYSNGQEQILGQMALAMFPSEAGLDAMGGNLYRETHDSGLPAIGQATVGGFGEITGYALEGSNVELEDEFVQMIQAQRAYQANTGVIRSADETLQQLVNLV